MSGFPLATGRSSAWRRWIRACALFLEAMDTTCDELQDRRIARLQVELDELKQQMAGLVAR